MFEEHTDIIQKGGRQTVFGHKLFLTGGASSLILDCEVLRGNPADQSQLQPLLQRQFDLYGRWPRQASFDSGFATRANLQRAQAQGIQAKPDCRQPGASPSRQRRRLFPKNCCCD